METEEQTREEKEPLGPAFVDASDASVGLVFIVQQLLGHGLWMSMLHNR